MRLPITANAAATMRQDIDKAAMIDRATMSGTAAKGGENGAVNRTVHLRVTGRVQGVFYRAWTEETAGRLDLAGWVETAATVASRRFSPGRRRPSFQ
jgi:hypothetical protein